jgi:hypothetical protein
MTQSRTPQLLDLVAVLKPPLRLTLKLAMWAPWWNSCPPTTLKWSFWSATVVPVA